MSSDHICIASFPCVVAYVHKASLVSTGDYTLKMGQTPLWLFTYIIRLRNLVNELIWIVGLVVLQMFLEAAFLGKLLWTKVALKQ